MNMKELLLMAFVHHLANDEIKVREPEIDSR